MPRYVIERTLPGAGSLSSDQLCAISRKSNDVLAELPNGVQWQQSYVTDDKLYCVYLARDPELIREHARIGGFPLDSVHEVRSMIDPTTGGV